MTKSEYEGLFGVFSFGKKHILPCFDTSNEPPNNRPNNPTVKDTHDQPTQTANPLSSILRINQD